MSVKSEKVLRKSICNHPKEYASFVKSLKKAKEIKGTVVLNYIFDERDKDKIICGINAIHEKLPSKFTYVDLKKIAEESRWIIDMNNFTDDVFEVQMYIRIFLGYKFGDNIGKNILFNELNFEIRENLYIVENLQ